MSERQRAVETTHLDVWRHFPTGVCPSPATSVHNRLRTHVVDGADLLVTRHTCLLHLDGAGDAKVYQLHVSGHQQEVGRLQIQVDDT